MYNFKLIKTINEVDKQEWNSIIEKDNIICNYDFVKAIEESHINDCIFFYILIYNENNILIAHTWFYVMSMDLVTQIVTENKGIIAKLIKMIRIKYPRFLNIKILECGSPIALGNIITINNNENININDLYKIISDNMTNIGKQHNAKLLIIRDIYKKDTYLTKYLKKFGFSLGYNLPDVELINKWNTFDEYIKDLRFKYRRYYKICNSCLTKENIVVEITKNFNEYIPQLLKLYLNFYKHAKDYQREILTNDFFSKTSYYMNNNVVVILLKKENNIVGFAYLLLDDYTVRLLYGGMDYDSKDKYKTYFNIYYEVLKFAINNKFKKIELGLTSYEFKSWLGGEKVTLYAFLKHLNPFLNFLLSKFSKLIFHDKKVIIKHPFKNK